MKRPLQILLPPTSNNRNNSINIGSRHCHYNNTSTLCFGDTRKRYEQNNHVGTKHFSTENKSFPFPTKPIPIEEISHDVDDGDDDDNNDSNDTTLNDKKMIENAQQRLSIALKPYHDHQQPVLIRNFYNNNNNNNSNNNSNTGKNENATTSTIPCRALEHWSNLDYLQNTIGANTLCFVEIGGSYNNKNNNNNNNQNNNNDANDATSSSSRPEIPFGGYVSYIELFHEKYGRYENDSKQVPNMDEMVYMAQNDISTLSSSSSSTTSSSCIKEDFIIPQLCHDKDENVVVGHGSMYNSMFWFGPKHSVSPMHYDPMDNLLMQFVGRKQIVLFPKDDAYVEAAKQSREGNVKSSSSWHYAGTNGQQYNTSPIDIMQPDLDEYPNFDKCPVGMVSLIHPGDILYIPSRWWHHVTSLDTAMSVNIWWR